MYEEIKSEDKEVTELRFRREEAVRFDIDEATRTPLDRGQCIWLPMVGLLYRDEKKKALLAAFIV